MDVAYHKKWSRHLGKEMEFKVYGTGGKPVLVFPTGCGRFYEFEDFGMVEAAAGLIEAEKIQLFTVDSVDCEAWLAHWMYPGDRGRRHLQYEQYIMLEIVPFIHNHTGYRERLMTMGCSVGAYHALNFLLKHPDAFDTVIALSGLYAPQHFVGDYMDDNVYYNFPLCYLGRLEDPWYLERIRNSQIVVSVGQGTSEANSLADTQALQEALDRLGVDAWVDIWGGNVGHDWSWWRKQWAYFLGEIKLNGPSNGTVGEAR